MQRCRLAGSLARRPAVARTGKRELSSQAPPPSGPGFNPEEPLPEPPNVFATVGAMGAGALGAVFIAAVGVWGVFKMAFFVASQTGRSMNAEKADSSAAASGASGGESIAGSSGGGGGGGDGAASGVKVASPLEPSGLLQLGCPAPSFAAAAFGGCGGWRGNGSSWVEGQ